MTMLSTTVTAALLASTLAAAPPAASERAPEPAPKAPQGADAGFDTDPATGATRAEVPQFAPVTADGETGSSAPPSSTAAGEAGSPAASSERAAPTVAPAGPPPEGNGAYGQGAMAPLPPPPPPVDPETIARGPWRGHGVLRLRIDLTGPVGGDQPSRANVVAAGGGAEVGWRINNWVEIGLGVEGRPHRRIRRTFEADGVVFRELADASLTNWDFGVVRFFYPLDGRVQPFIDLGGGLAVLGSLPGEDRRVGGQGRASLGTDFWVSKNLSLELGLAYRLTALDDTIGHHLLGRFGLGIHW